MKKLNYEYVKNSFKEAGYTLLSSSYTDVNSTLEYICDVGHINKTKWLYFKKGRRCPNCARSGKNNPAWKGGVRKLNVPLFDTYGEQLKNYQPVYKVNDGSLILLGVECYHCNNVFVPKAIEVRSKVYSINNIGCGDNNLYCSDKCKNDCKVYRFQPHQDVDPDSKIYKSRTEQQKARSCQSDHLKQLQFDEAGYNYCEKCGETVDIIELHHTLEVAKFGLESVNSAGHLLVCEKCHKEFTKQCKNY